MRLSLEKKKNNNNNNNNKRSRFNRVLCTIGARSLIKAASSDGRDLARLTATGGFRKTGNGDQYAFKKVNIEECVIVIYTFQTFCQLVALCP